jgi:hypothetical protein
MSLITGVCADAGSLIGLDPLLENFGMVDG